MARDAAGHVDVQVHERAAHLERSTGCDRLQRDVRLADGNELGREGKREREAVVLGPAAVELQLAGQAELEAVPRLALGLATGGRGRLPVGACRPERQDRQHAGRDSLHTLPQGWSSEMLAPAVRRDTAALAPLAHDSRDLGVGVRDLLSVAFDAVLTVHEGEAPLRAGAGLASLLQGLP